MNTHISVLTEEVLHALAIKESSVIIDATFGAGGHAQAIVKLLGKNGTFIGLDADATAIAKGRENLSSSATVHLEVANFRNINSVVEHLHIKQVDGILADLGWRMDQFGGNQKGFSFQVDEPLTMTFGDPSTYPFTARDIINEWEEDDIANVLKGYGEERFARRIAKRIVETRTETPIETTFQLVEVVKASVPGFYKRGKLHPATKTFQALRIAVNDEFDALDEFIRKSINLLIPTGRLAVISFHSLEDRIVKHLFKNYERDHVGTILTKKPITASEKELHINPRARSAKLRIFQKT